LLVGGAPVPWLPTVDPEVVIWSDLKSHVFHATFLANPFAIPAGTRTFFDGPLGPIASRDRYTEARFNYLILMGGDYGPWSASLGTFYPSRFIRIEPTEAELNAKRAGLVFRARAVFEQLSFNAMYFRNRQRVTTNPEAEDSSAGGFETFPLREDTLRFGVAAEVFDTRGSLDAVLATGEYDETPNFSLEFRHLEFGASLSREFGHYVRLNLHLNYHVEMNEFTSVALPDSSETARRLDYGGAFEFQF
jgi:hypothetical protein